MLRSWGAAEPSFLLTNSKLTFQMTMLPENTEYVTQVKSSIHLELNIKLNIKLNSQLTTTFLKGPDGAKRLKSGPEIGSYRGLKIINSRSFSMEDGAPPRDVLRRRVRTAEYYRIPYSEVIDSIFLELCPHSLIDFDD